jgi:hypothetical protein
MKRYREDNLVDEMHEHPEGEWVRYEDVRHAFSLLARVAHYSVVDPFDGTRLRGLEGELRAYLELSGVKP